MPPVTYVLGSARAEKIAKEKMKEFIGDLYIDQGRHFQNTPLEMKALFNDVFAKLNEEFGDTIGSHYRGYLNLKAKFYFFII